MALKFPLKLRGVISDLKVVIALFLNIIFLSRSFQDFSQLNKRFCPQVPEYVSVGHTSTEIPTKPTNNGFYFTSTLF